MYTKNDVFEQVKKIIAENLEIDGQDIQLDHMLSVYIKDSINFIKVVVGIETVFDVEFTDKDLETDNFTNVESLVLHVLTKLEQ
ncbi:acyl carrier protein [Clostridiales bacterium]|nr:acyl carrier protein [Clostridiales bacterium]